VITVNSFWLLAGAEVRVASCEIEPMPSITIR